MALSSPALAERINGWLAMIAFDAVVISYVFTGQIIPGVFQIMKFDPINTYFSFWINYVNPSSSNSLKQAFNIVILQDLAIKEGYKNGVDETFEYQTQKEQLYQLHVQM